MKIVKFKNGTYGIRKWTLFGYKFLSRSGRYWWHHRNFLDYCQFERLNDARERYEAKNDYGEVVK
jgi:hypothetical protein